MLSEDLQLIKIMIQNPFQPYTSREFCELHNSQQSIKFILFPNTNCINHFRTNHDCKLYVLHLLILTPFYL